MHLSGWSIVDDKALGISDGDKKKWMDFLYCIGVRTFVTAKRTLSICTDRRISRWRDEPDWPADLNSFQIIDVDSEWSKILPKFVRVETSDSAPSLVWGGAVKDTVYESLCALARYVLVGDVLFKEYT